MPTIVFIDEDEPGQSPVENKKPIRKVGRPKKYLTEEDRLAALKKQVREGGKRYYEKNKEKLKMNRAKMVAQEKIISDLLVALSAIKGK